MNLLESGEMYLETILVLSQNSGRVRSIDIAEHMGYSKASVSRAVGILRKNKYIEIDSEGHILLTESGRELAENIYERHTILTKFFIKLGVDENISSADACKIEHHISKESFEAIKEFVSKD